jgi:hypothetical protein
MKNNSKEEAIGRLVGSASEADPSRDATLIALSTYETERPRKEPPAIAITMGPGSCKRAGD